MEPDSFHGRAFLDAMRSVLVRRDDRDKHHRGSDEVEDYMSLAALHQ